MKNLIATNENTLFVVYDEKQYNETGEVNIILKTEILFLAKKLIRSNKNFNYSSYPPYCFAE